KRKCREALHFPALFVCAARNATSISSPLPCQLRLALRGRSDRHLRYTGSHFLWVRCRIAEVLPKLRRESRLGAWSCVGGPAHDPRDGRGEPLGRKVGIAGPCSASSNRLAPGRPGVVPVAVPRVAVEAARVFARGPQRGLSGFHSPL